MIREENRYLTLQEAADALGISKRGVYRAAKRAEAEGHLVRTVVLGKPVVIKAALRRLGKYHYDPHDQSPEAIERRKEWGCRGAHTPAKRGRPFDRDRFAWVTVDHLKTAKAFVEEVGGDVERALAIVRQFRLLEKTSRRGTAGRALEAQTTE